MWGDEVTITVNVVNIISICTCIVTVAGAIKVFIEIKKAFMKPLNEIDEKLVHYDGCLKRDKERLDNMDGILGELTQSINMLVKSNRTILYHLEDGNHTGEIKQELKELDDWLMEGKEYKNGR